MIIIYLQMSMYANILAHKLLQDVFEINFYFFLISFKLRLNFMGTVFKKRAFYRNHTVAYLAYLIGFRAIYAYAVFYARQTGQSMK